MKRTKYFAYFAALIMFITISIGFEIKVSAATVKQNIKISSVSASKLGIQLKWKNSYSATGYVVYRSKNGGKYIKYDETTSKSYTDTDVETGEVYKYKVSAYQYTKKKKKYSAKSKASESVVALPYGITELSVLDFSDYNLISWQVNPYASGYEIYRSLDKKTWEHIDSVDTNTGVYEDQNVDSAFDYSYQIAAYEIVNGQKYISVKSSAVMVNEEKGIDVSHHNGKINWSKVKKAGISFAMIRIGYGTKRGGILDRRFEYNYQEAKKNGIKIGLYFYSYADNVKEAKKEAKFTEKVLATYGDLDYPVAFDFENTYRNKAKYKKSNTKIITTYCNYLEKRGYDTSVYSFLDFFNKAVNIKKVSKYGIWLARWTEDPDKFNSYGIPNVQIWQYSDKGKIKGISGNVDLNLSIEIN